ncbi:MULTISPECIES: YqgE/AlgH family protein [Holospora]|uniref:UPF0301 protein K737_300760 n=2 Tax=Holospora TaxID=44747 RepID=A0A061JHG7_9PROT|nr:MULTISPECIES: YqgE/AlgH family protein [Holospora]ETZ04832.1 hypothetical protein K737_300760 [Holospora undulata HU1]GAJ46369.1 hypothetical protein HE1_00701 [Holospora elegans E1]
MKKIKLDERSSLSGCVLISFPNVRKQDFQKNVVFVFHHSDEGAMGFLINLPLQRQDWPETFKNSALTMSDTVLWGGGSDVDRGFLLHSKDYSTEETLHVGESYGVSPAKKIKNFGDLDSLEGFPRYTLTLIGYISWRAGQIEEELMNHDWIAVPASPNLLFETSPAKKWETALSMLNLHQEVALTYCPGSIG